MQAVLVSAEWLKKAFSAPSGALRAPSSVVPRTRTNSCGARSLLGFKSSRGLRPRSGSRTWFTGSPAKSSRATARQGLASRVGDRPSMAAACVTCRAVSTIASSRNRGMRSATRARRSPPIKARQNRVRVPAGRVADQSNRVLRSRAQTRLRLRRHQALTLSCSRKRAACSGSPATRRLMKCARRTASLRLAGTPIVIPTMSRPRPAIFKTCNAPTI